MRTITNFILFILLLAGMNASAQKKPNIVLILVDDYGWTDLSSYGSKFYETPNIDALAKGGMKFTNAYSACTVCSPSRAAILTGKSPARLHLTDWIAGYNLPYAKLLPPHWTKLLEPEETTLAEVLKPLGYVSASIGKWHLGPDEKYWPKAQGFDINVGGYSKGSPNSYFSPYNNPTMPDGPVGENLSDRQGLEAAKFITEHKDQPFFLYLPFYAVHQPIQSKPEYQEYFTRKADPNSPQRNPIYAGLIKSMDDAVGVVSQTLKKLGLEENTFIVFTSDNGGLIQKKAQLHVTSNLPLRDGKGSDYEGGVRVPAIFYWKGKIQPGTISDEPLIGMDLFNTVASVAGAKLKNAGELDGADLSPLIKSPTAAIKRDPLYWHYPHYHSEGGTPYTAIRDGDWKLIWFYETKTAELYNLKDDIGEHNDLSAENPAKVKELLADIQSWKKKVGAQDPLPNANYDESRKNERGKTIE